MPVVKGQKARGVVNHKIGKCGVVIGQRPVLLRLTVARPADLIHAHEVYGIPKPERVGQSGR